MMRGLEHLTGERGELGLFGLEKQLRGDLSSAYKYTKDESPENGARLYGGEEQWPGSKAREVPSRNEERVLYIEGARALEQAAQESFVLETFKTHLHTFLCSLPR